MIFLRDYSPIEYTLGDVVFNSDDTATMGIKGTMRKLIVLDKEKEGEIGNFHGIITFKKEDGIWKVFHEDIEGKN